MATTAVVGDLTRAVAGQRAQVTQILGSSSDPHEFEPRPSDARALSDAAVLFTSGGGLDEWAVDLARSAGEGATTVTLIDSVRASGGAREDGAHGEDSAQGHAEGASAGGAVDPHWWQDPANGVRAVEAIRAALAKADPPGARAYAENARAYTKRLRRLDRSIASCMARIPERKRRLVTTHDALGYFARRYDLEVVGALIPSLSTQAQASGRDIRRLVDQIRSAGVEAIFPETALNPRLERAVSREAGASVGGRLWADSLGPPGSGAETYIGSLAANAATLAVGMSAGTVRCRPAA